MTVIGVTSCGDNVDFSKLHNLTQAEIDEMHRRDSIEEEQRKRINADLVIENTYEMVLSGTSYDGITVDVPFDKIGKLFGMSSDDVIIGMVNDNVVGFAIEGSTHADKMTASNTNGLWGHWWDENGDITSWGDNARVFAEYYPEDESGNLLYTISIGQMPGKLVAGQQITFIECLKYQDKRFAWKITINVKAPESGTVDKFDFEQTVQAQYVPNTTYAPTYVEFDRDGVLKALGVNSIAETTLMAESAPKEYTADQTGGNGFWMDETGLVTSWGNNSAFFIEYHGEEDGKEDILNCLNVGNFPDWSQPEGWQTNLNFAFKANGKMAVVHVAITIAGFVDPEDKPGTTPADATVDVPLEFTLSADEPWPYRFVDVRDLVRNAFNLTTHEVFMAMNNQEIEVYLNELDSQGPSCNGNYGEYWVTTEGVKDEQGWPNAPFYVGFETGEDFLEFGMGINTDTYTTTSPIAFTCKLLLVYQGTTVTANFSVVVNPSIN